jgi:nucleoside-diphosphate-sugar epimerase
MGIYNVGSGVETQVIEVAKALTNKILYIAKRNEPHKSCADIDLIKNNLNWNPETNLLLWVKQNK